MSLIVKNFKRYWLVSGVVFMGFAGLFLIKYSTFTKLGFINQFCFNYSINGTTEKDGTFQNTLVKSLENRLTAKVSYNPAYVEIDYPNGDVPGNTGVCTDVVIRAYRGAGVDLQKLVHEDMSDNFLSYPKMWFLLKPDSNIDHRRVPNLMTFFKRHGKTLPISKLSSDYKPGDIVTWDLGEGCMHIGMVSSIKSNDGKRYQIIHNIDSGPELEDKLFNWRIIGHFSFSVQ